MQTLSTTCDRTETAGDLRAPDAKAVAGHAPRLGLVPGVRRPPAIVAARLLYLILVALVGWPTHAAADPIDITDQIDFSTVDPADHAYDRWYLNTVNGQPAGYWHDWLIVDGDTLRTGYEEVRHESHEGEASVTKQFIEWTETHDHQPIQIKTINQTGGQAIVKTYRFENNRILLTSTQAGRTIERVLPAIDGSYLTASQRVLAVALMRAKQNQTGDAFTFRSLDPLVSMVPFATTYTRAAERDQQIKLHDASLVKAAAYQISFSIMPGFAIREWADSDSRVVLAAFDLQGLQQVSRLTDKDVVNTAFVAPELADRSVIVPDKPIKNASRQKRIVYELHSSAMGSEHQPMQTRQQSVEPIAEGRVRVTVDFKGDPNPTPPTDRPTDAHRKASVMVDHEDPIVRQLATRAIRRLDKDADPLTIAKHCKTFVSIHLREPSLAIADGTASEAARTGKGDCTEAAVLLAAMLRHHNIPSRCVTGLVYSAEPFAGQRDVFVYHMWTQAWIADGDDDNGDGSGYWLDLDAAMGRYSTGHIALGTSAMGVDLASDQAALFPFMQDLAIKVIDQSR